MKIFKTGAPFSMVTGRCFLFIRWGDMMQEKKFNFWNEMTTFTRYLSVVFLTLWVSGEVQYMTYFGLFIGVLLLNLYSYFNMKILVEVEIEKRLSMEENND